MMNWVYINSGFNTGRYNMDFDLQLAKNYRDEEAVLRLYRWKPYCISLGANQPLTSVNSNLAAKDNIDVVVRPTGGRAVLHSEELTYSVIYPLDFTSSARDIYQQLNLALLNGLKIYDRRFGSIELENKQPNFSEAYKHTASTACFAVSAKSELKFAGKKLVGSAQRKFERVILQHGSILCGPYHKRITDYLNVSDLDKKDIKDEIEENTIGLDEILNKEIDFDRLTSSLKKGFENYYNITFLEEPSYQDILTLTGN
jgi:lipoate-protein ligase A